MKFFAGVAFGQRNGVFAAPAAQFEYDRVRIAEKVFAPTAFEPEIGAEYLFEFGLYHAAESEVLGETPQFVFSSGHISVRIEIGLCSGIGC